MGKRTRVVGIAGRFGARYGSTLRKRWKEVMERRYDAQKNMPCPFCGARGHIKRISVGIWKCEKCGAVWAGGAYVPRTGLNKHFPKVVVREE